MTPRMMPAILPRARWVELEWEVAVVGEDEGEEEEAREDGAELVLAEAEEELALLEVEGLGREPVIAVV